jgi:N-acetylglutamate synthase-like GNAT family acetyltransferase
MRIRPAKPSDLVSVLSLLADARLPAAGVAEHFDAFLIAEEGDRLIGAIGVERYPPHGLLRSAVVATERRGRGVGDALVEALLARSRGEGLSELWLLTETAESWFARRGFVRRERREAPPALAASAEFRGACPESAACLVLPLEKSDSTTTS